MQCHTAGTHWTRLVGSGQNAIVRKTAMGLFLVYTPHLLEEG